MCMIDDADPCTWFGTKDRKARKEHTCAECNRTIGIGETYYCSSYVSCGSFYENKACAHCHNARDWLSKHCGGWLTESLREELEEHFWSGYRADNLAKLWVGIQRQWKGFNGKPLMPIPAIQPKILKT